jgi:hypothetical protein
MKSPHITTLSGRRCLLAAPTAEAIVWADIAEHLAKINRHVGASALPISVAEHCVRVAMALPPELRPYGLLHGAHAAFLGDTSAPLKELLRQEYGYPMLLDRLEHRYDQVIFPAAGLRWPLPDDLVRQVKHADQQVYATEVRDLRPKVPAPERRDLPAPLPDVIKPWPWTKAADRWLNSLFDWCPATVTRAAE